MSDFSSSLTVATAMQRGVYFESQELDFYPWSHTVPNAPALAEAISVSGAQVLFCEASASQAKAKEVERVFENFSHILRNPDSRMEDVVGWDFRDNVLDKITPTHAVVNELRERSHAIETVLPVDAYRRPKGSESALTGTYAFRVPLTSLVEGDAGSGFKLMSERANEFAIALDYREGLVISQLAGHAKNWRLRQKLWCAIYGQAHMALPVALDELGIDVSMQPVISGIEYSYSPRDLLGNYFQLRPDARNKKFAPEFCAALVLLEATELASSSVVVTSMRNRYARLTNQKSPESVAMHVKMLANKHSKKELHEMLEPLKPRSMPRAGLFRRLSLMSKGPASVITESMNGAQTFNSFESVDTIRGAILSLDDYIEA
jgi:hypothetical protein